MKLQAEYNNVKSKISNIRKDVIMAHKDKLEKSGECKDINVRLAWDLLRAAIGSVGICELYDKYSCNDSHIHTLVVKVCKDLGYI